MVVPGPSEREAHRCDVCFKMFSSRNHLRRHEATHARHRSVSCPFCDKKFDRSDTARRHARACAPNEGSLPFERARPGRKRRACDRCWQGKVSCDRTEPCARCHSRSIACSYARLNNDPSSSSSMQLGDRPVEHRQHAQGNRRSPSSFLLRITKPGAYGASEEFAAATVDSSNEASASMISPGLNLETFSESNILFPLFSFDIDAEFLELPDLLDSVAVEHDNSLAISQKLEQIIMQLSTTYDMLIEDAKTQFGIFDHHIARKVFTVENLHHFAKAYFAYAQEYIPVIHRPSFELHSCSSILMLAIFFMGSVFCAPLDQAILARNYYDLAEELIFNQPLFRRPAQGDHFWVQSTLNMDIETLQAAILMIALQMNKNDGRSLSRLRAERNPRLVATMRDLKLFESGEGHGLSDFQLSSWHDFIRRETCVRAANHVFHNDVALSLIGNTCPLISIPEMQVRLPCSPSLFEAEHEEDFDKIRTTCTAGDTRFSISSVATLLFSCDQASLYQKMDARTIVTDLVYCLFCLMSKVMSSRTGQTIVEMLPAFNRATDRWKELWDKATTDGHITQEFLSGWGKHAIEHWALLRTILHVAGSGDNSCQYTRAIATNSSIDLNEFMSRYSRYFLQQLDST